MLVSRDGRWNGRQIVSTAWLRESTKSYSAVLGGNGYGYMWWLPFVAFPAWRRCRATIRWCWRTGPAAEFMLIDRTRDIVVVHRVDNSGLWYRRNAVDVGQVRRARRTHHRGGCA